jgi:acetolactate synthase-1/2/3 large subunit
MKLNGSQMVVEALTKEGVDVVFGYPGGAIMNVYDEIYKQSHFEHILTRHEQASIHAADGYARSSGKVGVAIVTSGPGFTNAVTGLATAYMDSVPLVVISGQVPSALIGTDAFQEIDAVGISRPCTKHNYLVQDISELPRVMKEAFYIASSGRPGPVHIDIPKDITAAIGEFNYPSEVNIPTYKPSSKGHPKQIKKALKAMSEAKKPLLYIGGGAILANASELIKELSNKTGIPAIETLMARGCMGDSNPNFFGMVGMHGEYSANMAMYETDLIISLGARFDDRVTGKLDEFGKNAKIIHVDVDPTSIAKIVEPDYPIVGNLKDVLHQLLEELHSYTLGDFSSWNDTLKAYRTKEPLRYEDSDESIKPQWVIEETGRLLGDRAIVSTDVGQHQMWTAQFYPFSHARQFITSGGLGTMGFGLPAALGVARAFRDKVSINFSGDGSILMNIQELMTCTEKSLPVVNIVLNNNYLGMVRQWQTLFYEDRLSETDLSMQPDFIKLVESFGGVGYQVKSKDEFERALNSAVESKKVAIIEVIVTRREEVLPMVPNGHSLNEMFLLSDNKK